MVRRKYTKAFKIEAVRLAEDSDVTVGVVGVVLLPMWAALGAAAALITDCTIAVEKVEESE